MMLKDKEQDIRKIINALYNCNLADLCDEKYDLEENVIKPFEEKYDKPFDWDSGATKVVLIFKDLGFVIKMPLTYCDGEELCGADDAYNNWDYCEQEVTRFEWMQDEKVDKMFAETRYLTNIYGFPIYIQEYAEVLSDIQMSDIQKYSSHTDKDTDKVLKISIRNGYESIDTDWEADILVNYGEEFYNHFMSVIADYCIDDLRETNIGYIGKRPVIIDYSGFNS